MQYPFHDLHPRNGTQLICIMQIGHDSYRHPCTLSALVKGAHDFEMEEARSPDKSLVFSFQGF
jgi:hypothetical protein